MGFNSNENMVTLSSGETLTVFLKQNDKLEQVEIRMALDGKVEIFTKLEQETISFEDWKPLKNNK